MLSIEQIAFAMPSISKAADSAKNTGTELFPNNGNDAAQLIHDDNLVDNGDGTFTFTSKISAKYSYSDTSENRIKSTDDYYTFKKPGKYLIELWGADGGDGGRALLSGRNGLGGTGGFVYGVLDVATNEVENAENEKKLFYEIGSKGESKTYDMTAGGSGGDGGGAGEIALVSVGAGGGYSAVYLIDGDADPFGDKNTFNNRERDDTGKVLMIAGGGGGGAAGANGFHLTALILKMHGDGGDGGTYRSLISATPNIEGFTSGTYYAGENGTSSGGKTSYVGQGGTDRPEGLAKTTIGFMTASTYANDWQMTYHPDLHRGVGGAGNLHGGGGGAGFAGGGGGIQNVILDANNVGGGGGGSSYIADNATISSFYPLNTGYADIDKKTRYFVEEGVERPAGGGAIVITYLDDDDTYYDYLKDVEISGEVSQYFDIVKADSNCKNYKYASATTDNLSVTTTEPIIDYDDNKITISGSLEPIRSGLTKGQAHDTLTLTLKLKPKTGFMGGNDVPIFDTGIFSCESNITGHTDKNCTYSYSDTYETQEKLDSYKVSHVNVPFRYKVEANSFTSNKDDIYGAGNIIGAVDTENNEFTDPISDPYVTYSGEKFTAYDSHYNNANTYKYDVNIDVKPKTDGANSVGDANTDPTTLKAQSVVQVIDGLQLDGYVVKPKKTLTYDETGGTYDFKVDLNVKSKEEINKTFYVYDPVSSTQYDYNADDDTNTTQTTYNNVTLEPGYYYIEAWAGDGGKGADNTGWFSWNGGAGGQGGNGGGYIKIDNDSLITIVIGKKGSNGSNATIGSGGNGTAGANTTIKINNSLYLEVTGGRGGTSARSGQSGSAGAAGTVTTNTLDSSLNVSQINNDHTSLGHLSNGNGAVRITKLGVKGGYVYGSDTSNTATSSDISTKKTQLKSAIEDSFKINGFTLEEDFSQYFDIYNAGSGTATGHKVTYNVNLANTSINEVTTTEDGFKPIAGLSYTTEKRTYNYSVEGDASYTLKLKPKDLVGGNDIPLLDKDINEDTLGITAVKLSHSGTTTESDDVAYVEPNPSTDYANVEIDEEAFELTNIPQEVIVDYGEAATINADIEYASGKNDEFVANSVSVAPSELTKDGTYTVVGTVKSDDAQKAVEIPSVEPKYKSGQVNVRIKYTVNKVLTDLHQASVEYLDNGKTTVMETGGNVSLASEKDSFTVDDIHDAYVFTIEPDANFDLPADTAVTVTYDDAEAVMAADIKKKNGKMIITIPSRAFTNNITISASGIENRTPHYVHFLYQIYDSTGGPKNGSQTKESTLMEGDAKKAFYSGDELDTYVTGHLPYDYTSVILPEGYEGYVWEWSVEENEAHKHIMGDKDVYIMGSYKPITYTLIINYVAADQNGTTFAGLIGDKTPYKSPEKSNYNEADGSYDIALTNGAEYMVKSPEVEGYVPDKLYYSGKVDEAFFSDSKYNSGTKTFTDTVTYSPKETIYRIICDDYGIPVEELLPRGTTPGSDYFNFKTTKWDVDTQTGKEGEVEADFIGDSGTYYVYYKPYHNEYTVQFHKVDQNSQVKPDEQNIKLAYDNCKVYEDLEFGYDFEKETYVGFPNIICANYLFDGWYTADGKPIDGDTIVRREYADASNEIHLYARWKSNQVQIRIDYKYGLNEEGLAGQPVGDSVDRSWTYGKYYSFNSPDAPTGYKLFNNEQAVIDGVAWDDVNEIVYYISQSGTTQSTTLTINVYSKSAEDENNPGNPKANAYTLEGGTIKLKNSNGDVIASVANKGTVTLNNIQYPFEAGNYTIEVEPPEGYEADTKPITLVSGGNASVNIFLDREPLMLPMAGSTPMTGYTVFGISAMILSALLMFAYVNRRTEENNENE